MAIAHRSVILECFACVGLVLTIIVHRLVWPWYRCRDQMSIQRRLARRHRELECGTGVSRSLVENHITTRCRRGHVGARWAMLSIVQSAFILLVMNTHSSDDRGPIT